MTKEEYAAYLATPHWQEVREAALKRAEHRCQLCNASKCLNVHHRTYERVGRESANDLTVLCRKCHEHFHGVPGAKPRTLAKPSKPVAKDNWSQLPGSEQELLRQQLVAILSEKGPQTSKRMASMVGRRTQVVGSALVDMRRRGSVAKRKNRWSLKRVGDGGLGQYLSGGVRDTRKVAA